MNSSAIIGVNLYKISVISAQKDSFVHENKEIILFSSFHFLFSGSLFCQDTTLSRVPIKKTVVSKIPTNSNPDRNTEKTAPFLKGNNRERKRTIYFHDDALGTVIFGVKIFTALEEIASSGYYLVELTNGTIIHGKIISKTKKRRNVVETAAMGREVFCVDKIKTIKLISSEGYASRRILGSRDPILNTVFFSFR